MSANDALIWVDLEMTGLDVAKDTIIEIACLITDGNLNVVAEGPNLIVHRDAATMGAMNEWCIKHHGESGLTDAVLASTLTVQEAEAQVLAFVKKHVPTAKVGVLSGNSIHQDKLFLMKEMPALLEHLHYRLVDVSTVKELARRWYPAKFAQLPPKKYGHRAMDDIKESLQELRTYREAFFAPA